MSMFGFTGLKSKKTPQQLVDKLKDVLDKEAKERAQEQGQQELRKRIKEIKDVLYGEVDSKKEDRATPDENRCFELSNVFIQEDMWTRLVNGLAEFAFEEQKHVQQILCNLIRRDYEGKLSEHIAQRATVLDALVNGYQNSETALNCGEILRECIRHEPLNRYLLNSETALWLFMERYVHLPAFDLASDAFATLREMLVTHDKMAAKFLDEQYEPVFDRYNKCLLQSENYVTKRQSLKLLGEILLDRANFTVMMRYISSRENLKLMMLLLRDKSANIQFEAFHVFKVFVANPRKPDDVKQILVANRDKLIAYLEKFQSKRDSAGGGGGDKGGGGAAETQFEEEKQLLIDTIRGLQ